MKLRHQHPTALAPRMGKPSTLNFEEDDGSKFSLFIFGVLFQGQPLTSYVGTPIIFYAKDKGATKCANWIEFMEEYGEYDVGVFTT